MLFCGGFRGALSILGRGDTRAALANKEVKDTLNKPAHTSAVACGFSGTLKRALLRVVYPLLDQVLSDSRRGFLRTLDPASGKRTGDPLCDAGLDPGRKCRKKPDRDHLAQADTRPKECGHRTVFRGCASSAGSLGCLTRPCATRKSSCKRHTRTGDQRYARKREERAKSLTEGASNGSLTADVRLRLQLVCPTTDELPRRCLCTFRQQRGKPKTCRLGKPDTTTCDTLEELAGTFSHSGSGFVV